MNQVYFWKDGKVIQLVAPVYISDAKTAKVFNLFCVDDYEIDPELRYWYLKNLTPVLPEDVPKELKTLALLMGV